MAGSVAGIGNIAETVWGVARPSWWRAFQAAGLPETTRFTTFGPSDFHHQQRACVTLHVFVVREQVHHVVEGREAMEIVTMTRLVRQHDVIFTPPGVCQASHSTGVTDLTFSVVTSPS